MRQGLWNSGVRLGLAFCAGLLIMAGAQGQNLPGRPQSLPSEQLTIDTGEGEHVFSVEIADDGLERNIGMMFRTKLDADKGMLFDYPEETQAGFWMKNTYIPLDLIFIRADGSIANIAANATPLSLDPIPSDGPVRGVLEIRGGLSAQLGIEAGDMVRHRFFGNATE